MIQSRIAHEIDIHERSSLIRQSDRMLSHGQTARIKQGDLELIGVRLPSDGAQPTPVDSHLVKPMVAAFRAKETYSSPVECERCSSTLRLR